MNNKMFTHIMSCLVFIFLGCSSEDPVSTNPTQNSASNKVNLQANSGAAQLSGLGFYAEISECDYLGQGADYAVRMTGDLEGCLYVFVEEYDCSPSGTYRESGREYFVGNYNGEAGTFWTNYNFESKFEGCAEDGAPLGAEIFGRCQHPVEKGSGTGIFEGVTGRIDMKDDIEAGNFPYRGHLKY
jgi:hypothetical protein